ncbi:3-deoxy-7-phosphoheptulonate synthase [Pelomonas sp. APW6]|uniref:Phospho-2-dehydro-3-deoxyheptonate aldolase n=1 Tax=Roseateles subflavus TaxID=3053353 RepID=A0ABT7LP93_9BURK|nr:3-deoxy-7-phosphoheptulonate synthase [Pelomonas sp. APW6]MDL5033540.1 3-deoxy-7-phosphoheptulonate synthase [Pelomonas sp. APW6]
MTVDVAPRAPGFVSELLTPAQLKRLIPCGATAAATVQQARQGVRAILQGRSDRLLVLIGPCSIHDCMAARHYARRLLHLREQWGQELEIVMRAYLEKPRTALGWTGLLNDPFLDGSGLIAQGLEIGRSLLEELNAMGMPVAHEVVAPASMSYLDDLLSWVAIGARTSASPVHRQLASGLGMPVGFKNGVEGQVQVAVDAIQSARHPHSFLALQPHGQLGVYHSTGNPDAHLVMRGGTRPNYDADSLAAAAAQLRAAGLPEVLVVDASHGNSQKDHRRQSFVCADLAAQISAGNAAIGGVMIESHLAAGRQDLKPGVPPAPELSITDACIGWEESAELLRLLAHAVRARRSRSRQPAAEAAC